MAANLKTHIVQLVTDNLSATQCSVVLRTAGVKPHRFVFESPEFAVRWLANLESVPGTTLSSKEYFYLVNTPDITAWLVEVGGVRFSKDVDSVIHLASDEEAVHRYFLSAKTMKAWLKSPSNKVVISSK